MATAQKLDLTGLSVPCTEYVRFAISNKAYVVELPRDCGSIVIQPWSSDMQFAYSGIEGVSLGNDAHDILASTISEWRIDRPANTGGLGGVAQQRGGMVFVQTADIKGPIFVIALRPRDSMYPI